MRVRARAAARKYISARAQRWGTARAHRRRCLAGKRESESLVAEIDTGSENLVLPHVSAYGDLYDA